MKVCSICKIEKEENCFGKSKRVKSGLRSDCKECRKKYAENNKDKIKIYKNKHYKDNKNHYKIKSKKYREEHKSELSRHQKQYREENKEEIAIKKQNDYKKNREKILPRQKVYQKEHRNERNEYIRERMKYDLEFKAMMNFSTLFRQASKNNNLNKNGRSCWKLVGYSKEEYIKHIESLFENWMNWSNQGVYNPETWDDNDSSTWVWQLDHIICQSKLSYTDFECENFKKCWALSNLRPYSAKQNIIDGNRRV
jgi:hypothetical protein